MVPVSQSKEGASKFFLWGRGFFGPTRRYGVGGTGLATGSGYHPHPPRPKPMKGARGYTLSITTVVELFWPKTDFTKRIPSGLPRHSSIVELCWSTRRRLGIVYSWPKIPVDLWRAGIGRYFEGLRDTSLSGAILRVFVSKNHRQSRTEQTSKQAPQCTNLTDSATMKNLTDSLRAVFF